MSVEQLSAVCSLRSVTSEAPSSHFKDCELQLAAQATEIEHAPGAWCFEGTKTKRDCGPVALRSCFTLDRPSWDRRPQSCSNIAYHPQTANQPSLYRALFGSRSRRRGADEGGMTFLPSGPASNSACRKFDHKPRSIRPTQNLSDRNRTKLERFFALVRHPST